MKRLAWWLTVGGLWLAALWRVPEFPGPWGVPDGLLLALLAWVFARRAPAASSWAPVWMGMVLGAMKDVAGGGPFGSWAAIFAGTAAVVAHSARTIARDHPLAQCLWVTLFAMGTILAYALLLCLRGEQALAGPILLYFLLPSALATALVSLGLFPLLRRLL